MDEEFRFDFGSPSAVRHQRPRALFWFRLYVSLVSLFFGSTVAFGFALMVLAPSEWGKSPTEAVVIGLPYVVIGGAFLCLFAVSFFFPPKPWAWTYGVGLLVVGFFGCCTLPVSIPLLVLWFKAETQRYFGLHVK